MFLFVFYQLCSEKHQSERRKWLDEKLLLIGQAKEAEGKRNQEMRKFAEDRERHAQQQSQLVGTRGYQNMSLSRSPAEIKSTFSLKKSCLDSWQLKPEMSKVHTSFPQVEVQILVFKNTLVKVEVLTKLLYSSKSKEGFEMYLKGTYHAKCTFWCLV